MFLQIQTKPQYALTNAKTTNKHKTVPPTSFLPVNLSWTSETALLPIGIHWGPKTPLKMNPEKNKNSKKRPWSSCEQITPPTGTRECIYHEIRPLDNDNSSEKKKKKKSKTTENAERTNYFHQPPINKV